MRKKAVIILAEGFEEIEAITAIDVLRRAGIDVLIAGAGLNIVTGSRGIQVKVDIDIDSYDDLPDAVVLPGGIKGVENLARSRKVNELVVRAFKSGKIIGAICAAPAYVLAPLGLLDGKKVTCYPSERDRLGGKAIYKDERVVVDGNLITSKGPATAFDFSLKLVEVLRDGSIRQKVGKATLYE